MLFADVDTNWATVALTALGIVSFILKWVRDEQIAKNNARDRLAKMNIQTEQVVSAVSADLQPVKEVLAVVKHNTNGGLTDAVKTAVRESMGDNASAEVKAYKAGGDDERRNPTK